MGNKGHLVIYGFLPDLQKRRGEGLRKGDWAHLSAVLEVLQDAGKGGAELRSMLPTLGHDAVPEEGWKFEPTHSLQGPLPGQH